MQGQTARNLVLTKFGRLPTKYEAWKKERTFATPKRGRIASMKPKAINIMMCNGELLGSG